MRTRRLAAAVLLPTLLFAVSACGLAEVARPEKRADATQAANQTANQTAIQKGAAQAGAFAFRQTGHELAGGLSCSDKNQGYGRVMITCKGTTTDGKSALLTANLTRESQVVNGDGSKISDAEILGTVNGSEVFDKDCIGEGCRAEDSRFDDDDNTYDNT
jgi:hypothetical protein